MGKWLNVMNVIMLQQLDLLLNDIKITSMKEYDILVIRVIMQLQQLVILDHINNINMQQHKLVL